MDADGNPVDGQGAAIPTDPMGNPLSPDGAPVAADGLGNPVPLDADGNPVNAAGEPIAGATVDADGNIVDAFGMPIVFDAAGNPITGATVGPDGAVMLPGGGAAPVSATGEPLATDDAGAVLDGNGNVIMGATIDMMTGLVSDAAGNGIALDAAGNPISITAEGAVLDGMGVVVPEASVLNGTVADFRGDALVTDMGGVALAVEAGSLVPLDPVGNPIMGASFLPDVRIATGPDGAPLPRDFSGNVVGVDAMGARPCPRSALCLVLGLRCFSALPLPLCPPQRRGRCYSR